MISADNDALLVVVDMQRVFADPASPWCVPGYSALEAPIVRLMRTFGERACFTRFMPSPAPEGSWRAYYQEWAFALEPESQRAFELALPWSEYDHPVIDKLTFSAYGSELQALIRRLGVSAIVLCGVSTECCVLATGLAAVDNGISVRIVRDACAAADPETHDAALRVALTGFAPMIALTTVEEETASTE